MVSLSTSHDGAEQVGPAYDGGSILNLHHTLLGAFGATPDVAGAPPLANATEIDELLGNAHRVVVFLLDALGYRALQAFRAAGSVPLMDTMIAAGCYRPLTSVFPSATNNVLQSFHTGLAPAAHGLPGYRLYLKEVDAVGEMISFTTFRETAAGITRERLEDLGLSIESLAHPTLFDRLSAAGVPSTVLFRHSLLGSHLSGLNHRGASRTLAFVDTADQMVRLRRILEEDSKERSFVYTYWDAIDTIQHIYGGGGEESEAELAKVLYSMERELLARLPRERRRGTVLVLLSDHGQTTVPADGYFSLHDCPEVLEHLERPLGGNERVTYVRARGGRKAELEVALKAALPSGYEVAPVDRLLAAGLYGPGEPHAETQGRIGDFVIFAPSGCGLVQRVKETRDGGIHGGLSADEMLIPCLAVDLGEIG